MAGRPPVKYLQGHVSSDVSEGSRPTVSGSEAAEWRATVATVGRLAVRCLQDTSADDDSKSFFEDYEGQSW